MELELRTAERMKFPTPRDLNEPEGWCRSSFINTVQPDDPERDLPSYRGVWTQGSLYPVFQSSCQGSSGVSCPGVYLIESFIVKRCRMVFSFK